MKGVEKRLKTWQVLTYDVRETPPAARDAWLDETDALHATGSVKGVRQVQPGVYEVRW